MNNDISLKNIIAPHFWNIFNNLKVHNLIYGGRGSTKTSMIALNIVFNCINDNNCACIILRRYQNLLRNSVYKEIKRACKRLGLIEKIDYKANVSPMQIVFNNGNTIYFAGGDDYEAVKGTIDENSPIKKVWFEELTGWNNADEIDQIIATFTRGNNENFNVFYSYNPPKNRYHWVNLWKESK
jgi:phage terminase large subunit